MGDSTIKGKKRQILSNFCQITYYNCQKATMQANALNKKSNVSFGNFHASD